MLSNISKFDSKVLIAHLTRYFYIPLMLFTLLRNGFSIYGIQLRNFGHGNHSYVIPKPYSQDPIRLLLNWIGNYYGWKVYLIIYISFLILMIFVLEKKIEKRIIQQRDFRIALTLLPGVTIILERFGTLDMITILFSVLAALSVGYKKTIFLLLLTLSNVESSLVMAGTFVLLSYVPYCRNSIINIFGKPFHYFPMLFLSSVCFILNSFFLGNDSRLGQLPNLIIVSIAQFLASGTWLIYSWFGGLWFIILRYLKILDLRDLNVNIVIISWLGIFSIITADGTRVAANLMTYYCVCLLIFCERIRPMGEKWLLIGIMSPALNISNLNIFLPFHQILHFIGNGVSIVTVNL